MDICSTDSWAREQSSWRAGPPAFLSLLFPLPKNSPGMAAVHLPLQWGEKKSTNYRQCVLLLRTKSSFAGETNVINATYLSAVCRTASTCAKDFQSILTRNARTAGFLQVLFFCKRPPSLFKSYLAGTQIQKETAASFFPLLCWAPFELRICSR